MSYIWPMALVVFSNIIYQICAKSVPEDMNPFASLTVTYLVAAAACGLLYFISGPRGGLLREYGKLNWAPLVLGIVIIGLEKRGIPQKGRDHRSAPQTKRPVLNPAWQNQDRLQCLHCMGMESLFQLPGRLFSADPFHGHFKNS